MGIEECQEIRGMWQGYDQDTFCVCDIHISEWICVCTCKML